MVEVYSEYYKKYFNTKVLQWLSMGIEEDFEPEQHVATRIPERKQNGKKPKTQGTHKMVFDS